MILYLIGFGCIFIFEKLKNKMLILFYKVVRDNVLLIDDKPYNRYLLIDFLDYVIL